MATPPFSQPRNIWRRISNFVLLKPIVISEPRRKTTQVCVTAVYAERLYPRPHLPAHGALQVRITRKRGRFSSLQRGLEAGRSSACHLELNFPCERGT